MMCLAVFVHGKSYTADEKKTLVAGARALGAAFQKVNFLRDLAADFDRLGRSYFPNVSVNNFDEATKERLVADIQEDLATSSHSLPLLPMGARRAPMGRSGSDLELVARSSWISATSLSLVASSTLLTLTFGK